MTYNCCYHEPWMIQYQTFINILFVKIYCNFLYQCHSDESIKKVLVRTFVEFLFWVNFGTKNDEKWGEKSNQKNLIHSIPMFLFFFLPLAPTKYQGRGKYQKGNGRKGKVSKNGNRVKNSSKNLPRRIELLFTINTIVDTIAEM